MIAEGLRQSIIDVEPITCPIGDGGEGTGMPSDTR